jgi:hypothetical protein
MEAKCDFPHTAYISTRRVSYLCGIDVRMDIFICSRRVAVGGRTRRHCDLPSLCRPTDDSLTLSLCLYFICDVSREDIPSLARSRSVGWLLDCGEFTFVGKASGRFP